MKNEKLTSKDPSLDVIGIGNAIVDVLTKIDDSFLKTLSLTKGSMTLVDEKKAEYLYKNASNTIQSSGGSVANSLTCISQLGGKAGFIGRVKDDKLGTIFKEEMSNTGTIFKIPPSTEGPSTARCLIFVTPDAERTMCTYLGASVLIDPNDINLSQVSDAKILYLEGYLWDNSSAKNAFIKASQIAKNAGRKVALSLSDSFCVNRHRESFINLIEENIDILFANEEEVKSLYKTSDLSLAINNIKNKCEIVIITRGANGSIVISENLKSIVKPYILGTTLDTTGAGDSYAGGFLKGITSGLDPIKSAKIGSICAGHIVTKYGSRSDENLSKILSNNIHI